MSDASTTSAPETSTASAAVSGPIVVQPDAAAYSGGTGNWHHPAGMMGMGMGMGGIGMGMHPSMMMGMHTGMGMGMGMHPGMMGHGGMNPHMMQAMMQHQQQQQQHMLMATTGSAYGMAMSTPAVSAPTDASAGAAGTALAGGGAASSSSTSSVAAGAAASSAVLEKHEENPDGTFDHGAIQVVNTNGYYNLNEVLARNITSSDYFTKTLIPLATWEQVMDEIYNEVDHLEPFSLGKQRMPSTAFCLVYKLCTMKLTKNQVKGTLTHRDSPYIRGIGFLYLRYVAEPQTLWEWFSPYLDDPEVFVPGGNKNEKKTIGEFCRGLISDLQYYGTVLRRIAIPIQREFKKRLLALELQNLRGKQNEKYRHTLKVGSKVIAEFSEDGVFYDAVIKEVMDDGRFWITFTQYGNSEACSIGAFKMGSDGAPPTSSHSDSSSGASSGGSSSGSSNSSSSSSSSGSGGSDDKTSRDYKKRSTSHDRASAAASSSSASSAGSSRRRGDDDDEDRKRRRDSRDRDRRDSRDRDRDRDRDRERERRNGSGSDRRRNRSGSPSPYRGDRSRGGRSDSDDDRSSRRSGRDGRRSSRSRSPRGGGSSDTKSEADLEAEILKRERDAAVASGRNFAQRPASYKTALSMRMQVGTNRKRSKSPPGSSGSSGVSSSQRAAAAAAKKQEEAKKQEVVTREHALARAKLVAHYGDASASKKKSSAYSSGSAGKGVIDRPDIVRLGK